MPEVHFWVCSYPAVRVVYLGGRELALPCGVYCCNARVSSPGPSGLNSSQELLPPACKGGGVEGVPGGLADWKGLKGNPQPFCSRRETETPHLCLSQSYLNPSLCFCPVL